MANSSRSTDRGITVSRHGRVRLGGSSDNSNVHFIQVRVEYATTPIQRSVAELNRAVRREEGCQVESNDALLPSVSAERPLSSPMIENVYQNCSEPAS